MCFCPRQPLNLPSPRARHRYADDLIWSTVIVLIVIGFVGVAISFTIQSLDVVCAILCTPYMMFLCGYECMHKHARSTITMATTKITKTTMSRTTVTVTVMVTMTTSTGRRTVFVCDSLRVFAFFSPCWDVFVNGFLTKCMHTCMFVCVCTHCIAHTYSPFAWKND